jgi:hypothetical protein
MDPRQDPDSAAPESVSAWRRMNLKVKILALAGPVGIAAALAHGMAAPAPSPAESAPSKPAFASAIGVATAANPSAILAAPALAFAGKSSGAALDRGLAAKAPSSTGSAPKPPVTNAGAPIEPIAQALASTTQSAIFVVNDPVAKAVASAEGNPKNLSKALSEVDMFASIVTAIETFEEHPYYDPGGINVGMGYCVTKRLAEYGRERVEADLKFAGFNSSETRLLIANRDRKAISKIKITALNAVKLIDATRADYMGIARDAVGTTFDKMPEHRQIALGYLAYNTGDVAQFRKLVTALRGGDDAAAMRNMTVKWRDHQGELHSNHRLRSYIQAMFLGADHFKRAIANPMEFEGHMASAGAESALADIAGAAQKPGGLGSKLLARRMQSNAWAFKAYSTERDKAAPPQPKM